MTEHSDPDLLDLDDLPDTATLSAHAADPAIAGISKGVRALGRWAKRQHAYHKDLRALAVWVVGSVLVGAFGMVTTVVGAAVYVGARMERVEALGARVANLEARTYGHAKRPDDDGGE
jgi:hypothetical protein